MKWQDPLLYGYSYSCHIKNIIKAEILAFTSSDGCITNPQVTNQNRLGFLHYSLNLQYLRASIMWWIRSIQHFEQFNKLKWVCIPAGDVLTTHHPCIGSMIVGHKAIHYGLSNIKSNPWHYSSLEPWKNEMIAASNWWIAILVTVTLISVILYQNPT